MRVLVLEVDSQRSIEEVSGAETVNWTHEFGRDYHLETVPTGPEREVIKGLLDFPAVLPDGQELVAFVVVQSLTPASFFKGTENLFRTFTGEMSPRSVGDICLHDGRIHILHSRSGEVATTLPNSPLSMGDVAKLLEHTPSAGSYKSLTQDRIRALIADTLSQTFAQVTENLAELTELNKSMVSLTEFLAKASTAP